MKRFYNTPELEVTKFDFEQMIRTAGSPTDPGNVITNPFTTSDPDETMTDIPWGDWQEGVYYEEEKQRINSYCMYHGFAVSIKGLIIVHCKYSKIKFIVNIC